MEKISTVGKQKNLKDKINEQNFIQDYQIIHEDIKINNDLNKNKRPNPNFNFENNYSDIANDIYQEKKNNIIRNKNKYVFDKKYNGEIKNSHSKDSDENNDLLLTSQAKSLLSDYVEDLDVIQNDEENN